jgi:putative NIF3 family GTP cyclohydrolase 1 type 2
MTPEDILSLAAELAGFDEVPADSVVAHGAGRSVSRLMVSVGATTGDLVLARSLGCDAYLLHHPVAPHAAAAGDLALARLVELIVAHGVPRSAAEHAVAAHRRRLRLADASPERELLASAAERLDLTLLNVQLPADELAALAVAGALEPIGPESSLGQLAAALRTIPELARADPLIVPDRPEEEVGRVAVMIGAGVAVDAAVAVALFEESAHRAHEPVRTIVDTSFGPGDAKRLEARAESGATGSVVLTGGLPTDAIGMGLIAGALEARGLDVLRHGALHAAARGGFTPLPEDLGGTAGDGLGLPSTPP